ncbi:ATP-binding cassette domain-containing protein, partial [Streptomyces olivaceoviridis]
MSSSEALRTEVEDSGTDSSCAGSVRLDHVTHQYLRRGETVTAVGPVDLTVPAGEFLVLVGASGCGKSTLLRLVAGFEQPTHGSVRVSGAGPRPGESAGVVFQTPRLFPQMHVSRLLSRCLTRLREGMLSTR